MTGSVPDSDLLAAVHAFFTAELRGDVASLERLLAPDYQGFDLAGHPQDRDAVLAPYRTGTVKLEQLTPTDLHTRRFGDIGLVTGRSLIRGHTAGKAFDLRHRFLDVFVLRDQRWQLVASQVTTM